MERKRYINQSSTQNMLCDLCGTWISGFHSPDIIIFEKGRQFRLTLKYKLGAVLTFPVKQYQEYAFFYFYDFIQIAYDFESDQLILSTEGIYFRMNES